MSQIGKTLLPKNYIRKKTNPIIGWKPIKTNGSSVEVYFTNNISNTPQNPKKGDNLFITSDGTQNTTITGHYIYTGTQWKEVPLGTSIIGAELILVTFAEFVALQGEWKHPAKYVITDHQQIVKLQYTDTAGDGSGGDEELFTGAIEPLIIETISDDLYIKTSVKSYYFPQDVIYYSIEPDPLDQDANNHKGYIYYRNDEFGNVDNHDFRNILNRRWNDGAGNYTIVRKVDAPDDGDYKDFTSIYPQMNNNVVMRRGTPDQYYNRTNNVYLGGNMPIIIEKTSGSNVLNWTLGTAYLTDYAFERLKIGQQVIASGVPNGSVITGFDATTITIDNNATDNGLINATIQLGATSGNNAINSFISCTNNTLLDLTYNNQIHILLGNTFSGVVAINHATSVSGNTFDSFKGNMINALNGCTGETFNNNFVKGLLNYEIVGNVLNTNFNFFNDGGGETITATTEMADGTESTDLVLLGNDIYQLEEHVDGGITYRVRNTTPINS